MRQSAKEYLTALGHWGWVVLVDIAGALVGVGLDIAEAPGLPRWLWLSMLLGGLTIAPFLAFHKLRLQRDTFRTKLNNKQCQERALCKLAELRREGVELRNRGWQNVELNQEEKWWNEVTVWRQTVEENMNRVHPADGNNWALLGDIPPERLAEFSTVGVGRPRLQKRLAIQTIRCEKLDPYIEARTRQ